MEIFTDVHPKAVLVIIAGGVVVIPFFIWLVYRAIKEKNSYYENNNKRK